MLTLSFAVYQAEVVQAAVGIDTAAGRRDKAVLAGTGKLRTWWREATELNRS